MWQIQQFSDTPFCFWVHLLNRRRILKLGKWPPYKVSSPLAEQAWKKLQSWDFTTTYNTPFEQKKKKAVIFSRAGEINCRSPQGFSLFSFGNNAVLFAPIVHPQSSTPPPVVHIVLAGVDKGVSLTCDTKAGVVGNLNVTYTNQD